MVRKRQRTEPELGVKITTRKNSRTKTRFTKLSAKEPVQVPESSVGQVQWLITFIKWTWLSHIDMDNIDKLSGKWK